MAIGAAVDGGEPDDCFLRRLGRIALAYWIDRTLLRYIDAGNPEGSGLHATLDSTVMFFAFGLSLVTSLLFGLLPAWQSSKPDVIPEFKGAPLGVNSGFAGVNTRRLLIVFEIALSLVILFAAGLMTRTLSHLKTVDLGFDPSRVIALFD